MPGDAPWRSRGPGAAGALAAALLAAAAGCGNGDDGRTLRPPDPDQTTTTATATTVPGAAATTAGVDAGSATGDAAAGAPAEPIRLSSPAIPEAGTIPADHTCWGRDVSPPLAWGPVPPGTAEVALVVRDIDADGFVHWVVAGLPPTSRGLAEGEVPAGVVEALNDFGRPGWSGPCPPDGTHRYEFRVLALVEPSGVTAGQPAGEAAAQVEAAPARTSAVLSGTASPA